MPVCSISAAERFEAPVLDGLPGDDFRQNGGVGEALLPTRRRDHDVPQRQGARGQLHHERGVGRAEEQLDSFGYEPDPAHPERQRTRAQPRETPMSFGIGERRRACQAHLGRGYRCSRASLHDPAPNALRDGRRGGAGQRQGKQQVRVAHGYSVSLA